MDMNQKAGVLRVYGCGGCGIGLASLLLKDESSVGYADLDVVHVDTSLSNLRTQGQGAPAYVLDGVDGSGKIRRENSDAIADKIGDLLLEHRPHDLNIVCFSASGGSGSVFGPLIVKALLERDAPVVAIVVGSTESAITATNTLNTLKTLDAITDLVDAPLIMYYGQNPSDQPRSVVDKAMVSAMRAFRVLGSKQNEGLDTRDLKNFFRYDRASRAQPQLSLMEIATTGDAKEIAACGVNHVISVASIFRSTDALPLAMPNEYQCSGYLPAGAPESVPEEMHFLIHTDEVAKIVKAIQDEVKGYEEFANSRGARTRVVGEKDKVTDKGLVL